MKNFAPSSMHHTLIIEKAVLQILSELLDKFNQEYNRLQNLGCWIEKEDSKMLALVSSFETLQDQFSSLQSKYSALQAQLTKKTSDTPPTPKSKLNKPPAKKPDDPEVTEFEGYTWKLCNKCFGGSWNHPHITEEHRPGKGKSKNCHTTPPQDSSSPPPPTPTANLAAAPPSSEANIASSLSATMDIL